MLHCKISACEMCCDCCRLHVVLGMVSESHCLAECRRHNARHCKQILAVVPPTGIAHW